MAFLTGVDLEGRLAEEPASPLLALCAPPEAPKPRRAPAKAPSFALGDKPGPKIEYRQLLKDLSSYGNDEDPLEELRRLVSRTRKKMDGQRDVLKGFIEDVNVIKGMDRGFSCTDLATYSAPSSGRGPVQLHRQALAGHSASAPLALMGPSASQSALATMAAASAAKSSSTTALRRWPSGAGLLGGVGTGGGNSGASRGLPQRSSALGVSRSTPSLLGNLKALSAAGARGDPFAAKVLPPRRAPPGAPGNPLIRNELRASASAAYAKVALTGSGTPSASPSRRRMVRSDSLC